MHNEKLNIAIAEYLEARDSKQPLDVDGLIQRHPELQGELLEYFQSETLLEEMASHDSAESVLPRSSRATKCHEGTVQTASEFCARKFDRYELLRELGQGAMGVVYLARDTKLQRVVALKVPKQQFLIDTDFQDRFQREAQAAATLQHRSICQIHDVSVFEGTPYITMMYIDGCPLSRIIGTARIESIGEILAMFIVIAEAVQHAHSRGIVHRDLKPSNILVDADGKPHVADFGLARRFNQSDESRLTQDGLLLGTPAYMSPEQLRGAHNEIGPPSDIYAFGAMLFEVLTGRLPFQGHTPDMVAQVLRDPPPDPASLRSDIPVTLSALCVQMLRKEPTARPPSMEVVKVSLQRILDRYLRPDGEIGPGVSKDGRIRWKVFSSENIGRGFVGAILIVFLLWAFTIFLSRGDQRLKIEVADELWANGSLSLAIDGDTYEITGDEFGPIRVALGPHDFSVRQGDITIQNPQRFTIERNSEAVLVITSAGAELLKPKNGGHPLAGESVAELPSSITADTTGKPTATWGQPSFSNPDLLPGTVWEHAGVGVFRWCPAGKFSMGSPTSEAARESNETSVLVSLSRGFWMAELEVTQGLFLSIMNSQPWIDFSEMPRDDGLAACGVTWGEAMQLCAELTVRERQADRIPLDAKFTLPTEAQWEYACRAGTTTAFSFGSDPSRIGDYAWWQNNTSVVDEPWPHRVGLKKPNPWGLCDMYGNVYEWCRDAYASRYVGGRDPYVSEGDDRRINRGGGWDRDEGTMRSANRKWNRMTDRRRNVGFRLVLVK